KSDSVLLMRGVRMQREIRQLPVLNSFRWTLNKKQIYPGFRNIESDFINPIVERLRNLPLLPRSRWKKYKHTYVFQSVHRPFGFGVSESKSNIVILACAERYVSIQILDSQRRLLIVLDRWIRCRDCFETMNHTRRVEQHRDIVDSGLWKPGRG